MSLFLDRSRRAGPHLEWKVRAFAFAAVLGLGGIYFEERWMGLLAIVVLIAALAVKLLPSARAASAAAVDEEDEEDEEDEVTNAEDAVRVDAEQGEGREDAHDDAHVRPGADGANETRSRGQDA